MPARRDTLLDEHDDPRVHEHHFGAAGGWTPAPLQQRYGFNQGGFRYGWHTYDPRFDLANDDYTNEENRFGWVVEIDPHQPNSTPVKRTENTQRGVPGITPRGDPRPGAVPSNPLAPNPDGHIIRWVDSDRHTGTSFEWDIFSIAANTTDAAGQMFGSPDGIWADPDTTEFRRLLTGVSGCEITGVAITPDRRTMFVNVQHPGDGDPGLTNFPVAGAEPNGPLPRDATIVITRKNGGVIGS